LVNDKYVLCPRVNVGRVNGFDTPTRVILFYEGDRKHLKMLIEDGQVEPPIFLEGSVGHYSWQKKCSRAFVVGNSCLVRNLQVLFQITVHYYYSHYQSYKMLNNYHYSIHYYFSNIFI
jgi:hypothetical protein